MKRLVLFMLVALFSVQTYAFKCYVTVVKDNCWIDYNVTVQIFDDVSKKQVVPEVLIPKGKQWKRNSFECQAKQGLYYQATFTPVIWSGQKPQTYSSKRIWYLPEKIDKETEVAWNIPICYGNDFSSVPLPPAVSGNCQCDFSKVPAIK